MAIGALGCTALCGDLCKVLDIYWRRVCWVWWFGGFFSRTWLWSMAIRDGIEDRFRQEQLMLISFKIYFTDDDLGARIVITSVARKYSALNEAYMAD